VRHTLDNPIPLMNGLLLTEIGVFPESGRSFVLAYVNLTINGVLALKGIRVLRGDDGPFLSMPSRRNNRNFRCRRCGQKNALDSFHCHGCGDRLPPCEQDNAYPQGRFADVYFPTCQEFRDTLSRVIFEMCGRAGIDLSSGPTVGGRVPAHRSPEGQSGPDLPPAA
jgi:DNA-binding cell septation regulator SpoVG